jgi:hypothetical protein
MKVKTNEATQYKRRVQAIAVELRHPLWGKRDTIAEAFEYYFMLARTVNAADRATMIMGTMVLLNTIAAQLEKLEV